MAPMFPEHPVEGFGEKSRNDVSGCGCTDNSGYEKQRYTPERASVLHKDREKCEHDKHVRQIHFITALAKAQQRRKQARAFPLHLRGGNRDHASSQRDDGHVQAGVCNKRHIGQPQANENGYDQRRTGNGKGTQREAREANAADQQRGESTKSDGIHAAQI